MFFGFNQLGCREIAPPTLCVRDVFSVKCGCNSFGNYFLISDDVAGFLPGLVLLPARVSRTFWPACGPLEILEFTTVADAILAVLLLFGADNVALCTVTKLGLRNSIAYPTHESLSLLVFLVVKKQLSLKSASRYKCNLM